MVFLRYNSPSIISMKRLIVSLFVIWTMSTIACGQSLNPSQTRLRNEIKSFLQEEGFMPSIDKSGYIAFKKEGSQYWAYVSEEDTSPMYVTLGTGFKNPQEYSRATIMLTAADMNFVEGVKVICGEDSFTIQGEMFLGNAEQFKYSFYKILNQIERVVYAFDEACQNNKSGSGSFSGSSSYSNGSTTVSEPKIVNNPSIRTRGDNRLVFKRVIIADAYTALEMSTNNNYGSGYYTWCQIAKGTHLICGGRNYSMIKAEGIKIAPDKSYFSGTNSTLNFTLYFEPIPRSATSIDFYEENGSKWNTWGISL